MQTYLDLLHHIRAQGIAKEDRTGVGTQSVFGYQMRFDLQAGFPLVTTKTIHLKSVIHELLWFLRGDTNLAYLRQHGVRIWNEWADAQGELGPIYGQQWRSWPTPDGRQTDQIQQVIRQLQTRPDSRRILVSAWNPADLPDETLSPQANVAAGRMALAPCHALFQFYVGAGLLSCQLYQRSADVFLGVPFNIASYALLTLMLAQVCQLQPGEFIHTLGDAHIYRNHQIQISEQLSRKPYPLPHITLNPAVTDLFAFTADDIVLHDYHAHPPIPAPVAV